LNGKIACDNIVGEVFFLKHARNHLRIIHLILILTIVFSYLHQYESYKNKTDVLTVATGKFSGIFNPLYARSANDIFLCGICNELLLDYDRAGEIVLKGKTGEVRSYNGNDYTYYGLADCTVNKTDSYTDYEFELREDVYFSDGVNLTADDVIFTMYVMADPSYTGVEQFYTLPIEGMEDYRLGISADVKEKYSKIASEIYSCGRDNYPLGSESFDKKTFEIYWECFNEAWSDSLKLIADYCAGNYPELLEQFYGNSTALAMYGWGFCEIDEAKNLKGIASGKVWNLSDGELPAEKDFLEESLLFYSGDAVEFYNKALTNLSRETVLDKAENVFVKKVAVNDKTAGECGNISGIIKTGKYSFTVRMDDSSVLNLYKLSFSVLPLHYYGDSALFDCGDNKFGFVKGDLEKVKLLNSEPVGAGPYIFKEYSDGVVNLVRNTKYYKGVPKIENVALCELTSGDEVNEVLSGNINIATIGYDAVDIVKIIENNDNGELSENKIFSLETQVQSYGYIGINAELVKVGADAESHESKLLRKAFATMFSVYRDIAVSSFFYSEAGCRADVIEYPIPPSSWACPNPTDVGYKKAYSTDRDGNSIYSSGMTDDDRYTAALSAAVGYFIEAGYGFDEETGKFISAPPGAALKYNIVVPGGGTKAHPGYIIASMAADALNTVGIELAVYDLADTGSIWNMLQNSECDMWTAARSRGADPDLYQIYHSDSIPGNGGTEYNYHFIRDEKLDALIEEAGDSDDNRKRKQLYHECFEIISDWGIEVPVFSAKTVSIFDAECVQVSSVIKDATSFRDWSKEIENIDFK